MGEKFGKLYGMVCISCNIIREFAKCLLFKLSNML